MKLKTGEEEPDVNPEKGEGVENEIIELCKMTRLM